MNSPIDLSSLWEVCSENKPDINLTEVDTDLHAPSYEGLLQKVWVEENSAGRRYHISCNHGDAFAHFVIIPADKHIKFNTNNERGALSLIQGVVLGSYLRIIGQLALHANVLVRDGNAIAIAGQSGSGKSSLTCSLMKQGFKLLADDQFLFTFAHNGNVTAHFGRRKLRLWPDSVKYFDIDSQYCALVYDEIEGFDKLEIFDPDLVTKTPTKVSAIYCLEPRSRSIRAPQCQEVNGAEKLALLMKHRYGLIAPIGAAKKQEWIRLSKLADAISVFSVTMPDDMAGLSRHAQALFSKSVT